MLSLTVFLMNVDDGIPQTDKIPIISIFMGLIINLVSFETFVNPLKCFLLRPVLFHSACVHDICNGDGSDCAEAPSQVEIVHIIVHSIKEEKSQNIDD